VGISREVLPYIPFQLTTSLQSLFALRNIAWVKAPKIHHLHVDAIWIAKVRFTIGNLCAHLVEQFGKLQDVLAGLAWWITFEPNIQIKR
jgi:hypothetical protein